MANPKKDNVELLLSKLDKNQLADFISKDSQTYTSRVEDLIEDYAGRHGYIHYRATFDFNRAVCRILDEAAAAMANQQWEVAAAVLTGVSAAGEEILNSGDDSAGELGAIVAECFHLWHRLCDVGSLPEHLKSEIFELALTHFNEEYLKGWDWWWDWMEIAISLADTPEKQNLALEALDAIKPDNDWIAEQNAQTAKKYKLELMLRRGTADEQRKFLYDNVDNPDFRKRLIQTAWDNADYQEVLQLAKEGVDHDAELADLVSDWHKWEYQVYRRIGDNDNSLRLARYFFLNGGLWGEKEYSMEAMYSTLKALVADSEWSKYVDTLISEAEGIRDGSIRLLHIFTEEQMWDKYMAYIRNNPSTYLIDDTPQELKELYKEEIARLYALAVRDFF